MCIKLYDQHNSLYCFCGDVYSYHSLLTLSNFTVSLFECRMQDRQNYLLTKCLMKWKTSVCIDKLKIWHAKANTWLLSHNRSSTWGVTSEYKIRTQVPDVEGQGGWGSQTRSPEWWRSLKNVYVHAEKKTWKIISDLIVIKLHFGWFCVVPAKQLSAEQQCAAAPRCL